MNPRTPRAQGFSPSTKRLPHAILTLIGADLQDPATKPPGNPRRFFAELRRRNVYKVAVAYAIVAWLVIQISSTVLPTFHAPEWVVQTLVVLVALGFPIALVIAWAFELTPEGIKRTEVADAMPPAAGKKKHAWIYIVVICGAISVALIF